MKALAKTLAAAVVAGGALFGTAMAQETTQPETRTFTAEEVEGVKKLFNLQSCVEQAGMGFMLETMLSGKEPTEEELNAVIAKIAADCEASSGITEADANALIDGLKSKYGEENLDQVLQNSRPMFQPQ